MAKAPACQVKHTPVGGALAQSVGMVRGASSVNNANRSEARKHDLSLKLYFPVPSTLKDTTRLGGGVESPPPPKLQAFLAV